MDVLPLLCIVSVAFTGLTRGSGLLPDGPLNATVGETVMFNTSLPPTEKPFVTANWKFGAKNIITANIVNTTGPGYEGRITFFPSTASLELRNLALNDSGKYTINITPQGTEEISGITTLAVYARISDVIVTLSSTDLVEFNSSVRLSCSSSGSSPSFHWLNGSSEVTQSDRVQLTDGGANLTITNVTRYDEGQFSCQAFNPVSDDKSEPVNISISYGPENVNLTLDLPQEYYGEGSDVSLTCSAVSTPSAQFLWFLNGEKKSDTGTGSKLRLTDIQESQSGNYSCQAFNSKTLRHETSQPVAISVLTRVANIVVTLNTTDLLEFNSSVRLSCSSSGSFPSFLWLNGSSEVTQSDRVQLTDGGANLTIVSVTRYDQGPFRCHVFNPINNGTSDPVNISISYGPENVNLTLDLPQEYYGEGSNIRLMCSAVSTPSAQFMWFLNGDLLNDTGPELRLINIQMSQSGNYSCQAFNSKTLRHETSQPAVVSVLERISGASVTSSPNQPIEGNPVNITCNAAGSVFTREWMKDGSNLSQDFNKKTLSLQSLSKKDKGKYSCRISNPINSEVATYIMIVNYGPDNVQIKGPSEIHLKKPLTLNCSAESTPAATYTWTLNEMEIHNSPVFTKRTTELSDSGNYTCEARNDVTGRTSSVVHHLSVTGTKMVLTADFVDSLGYFPGKARCLGGCIAGIVCAICAVGGAVASGGYYFHTKQKRTKKSSNSKTVSRTGSGGQDNTAYAGGQELNYADIRFFQNNDGGRVQPELQNNSSEYAQVQVANSPPAASSPPTYDVHMQQMKRSAPQSGANDAQLYSQIRKT
ncbi:cell adhesion molecule CEACAM5-like [Pempheris klunzingeri]|uniref:cell adhesion molecule CEACAM5-like n=1 Tax=Pempheris klunzingeri TaxID=3127111 RepID=UPI00397EAD81